MQPAGDSSVVKHLPGMREALGLICRTTKKKNRIQYDLMLELTHL